MSFRDFVANRLDENSLFTPRTKVKFEDNTIEIVSLFWLYFLGILALQKTDNGNSYLVKYLKSQSVRVEKATDDSPDLMLLTKLMGDKGLLSGTILMRITKLLAKLKKQPTLDIDETIIKDILKIAKFKTSTPKPYPKFIYKPVMKFINNETSLEELLKSLYKFLHTYHKKKELTILIKKIKPDYANTIETEMANNKRKSTTSIKTTQNATTQPKTIAHAKVTQPSAVDLFWEAYTITTGNIASLTEAILLFLLVNWNKDIEDVRKYLRNYDPDKLILQKNNYYYFFHLIRNIKSTIEWEKDGLFDKAGISNTAFAQRSFPITDFQEENIGKIIKRLIDIREVGLSALVKKIKTSTDLISIVQHKWGPQYLVDALLCLDNKKSLKEFNKELQYNLHVTIKTPSLRGGPSTLSDLGIAFQAFTDAQWKLFYDAVSKIPALISGRVKKLVDSVYSLGATSTSIELVTCLQRRRDVYKTIFGDTEPFINEIKIDKYFTKEGDTWNKRNIPTEANVVTLINRDFGLYKEISKIKPIVFPDTEDLIAKAAIQMSQENKDKLEKHKDQAMLDAIREVYETDDFNLLHSYTTSSPIKLANLLKLPLEQFMDIPLNKRTFQATWSVAEVLNPEIWSWANTTSDDAEAFLVTNKSLLLKAAALINPEYTAIETFSGFINKKGSSVSGIEFIFKKETAMALFGGTAWATMKPHIEQIIKRTIKFGEIFYYDKLFETLSAYHTFIERIDNRAAINLLKEEFALGKGIERRVFEYISHIEPDLYDFASPSEFGEVIGPAMIDYIKEYDYEKNNYANVIIISLLRAGISPLGDDVTPINVSRLLMPITTVNYFLGNIGMDKLIGKDGYLTKMALADGQMYRYILEKSIYEMCSKLSNAAKYMKILDKMLLAIPIEESNVLGQGYSLDSNLYDSFDLLHGEGSLSKEIVRFIETYDVKTDSKKKGQDVNSHLRYIISSMTIRQEISSEKAVELITLILNNIDTLDNNGKWDISVRDIKDILFVKMPTLIDIDSYMKLIDEIANNKYMKEEWSEELNKQYGRNGVTEGYKTVANIILDNNEISKDDKNKKLSQLTQIFSCTDISTRVLERRLATQKVAANTIEALFKAEDAHKNVIPLGHLSMKDLGSILKFNNFDANIGDGSLSSVPLRKNSEEILEYVSRIQTISDDIKIPEAKVDYLELTSDEKDDESLRLSTFYNKKHGRIALQVLESFSVNITQTSEQENWLKEHPTPTVIPAFHGCGSIAASMILRFGFRIITKSNAVQITGKMLGDGVYFSNILSKALQYIGDTGYSRGTGTVGYVLEMDAYIGDKKGWSDDAHFNSAGTSGSDGIRSPEWCVYKPNVQLIIKKAHKVKMVPESWLFNLKKERNTIKESTMGTFRTFLTEAKEKNRVSFIFYDDAIPDKKGKLLTNAVWEKKYGTDIIFVEGCQHGIMVTFVNAPKNINNTIYVPSIQDFIDKDVEGTYTLFKKCMKWK